MKRTLLFLSVVLFLGVLALSWFTHGTGVIQNDASRSISIPKQLTVPLQVKAAYNDSNIFFRYRWPAARPGIFHDVLKLEKGNWVVQGRAVPGSEPSGLHEDRVAMMVDDGSVPEFSRYGGYITVGQGIATFTEHASGDAVKAHSYLGKKIGEEEITKYLPATRRSLGDWADVAPEDELKQQRAAGYFLDLWHWRANRSNPIDKSDDQVVAEARLGDAGRSAYATNWNAETKQPRLMFDQAKAGHRSLKWDDVVQGRVSQDSAYYLRDGEAAPFDPAAGWQDGDTLPRRILRDSADSRADISVSGKGRWADGFWDVTLTRALDTGNPLDDKIMQDKGAYTVAFAVHRDATGGRWHYVSLPFSLALGRSAEIVAEKFEGDTPGWKQDWSNVTLFYPGQVSWPHLNSAQHAGAKNIKLGVPVKFRHSEAQLAHYGVEREFANEIRRQWLYTLFAGVLLIVGFGIALNGLLARRRA
jgi:hypothetical protein